MKFQMMIIAILMAVFFITFNAPAMAVMPEGSAITEKGCSQEVKPMAYTTIADLKKRLKRSYDALYSDDDTGVLDEDLMQEDIDAASAEIDGSVAMRYDIPVTAADSLPLLKSWNLDLVAAKAYMRSGGTDVPESIQNAVDHVRKQLKGIADGNLRLPADPTEKTTGGGSIALVEIADPVFTRTDLEAW